MKDRITAHTAENLVNNLIVTAATSRVKTRHLIQQETLASVEKQVHKSQPSMDTRTIQVLKKNQISSLFSPSCKTDSMGNKLTLESSIAEHARSLFPLYQSFYDDGPREIHGIAHVCRVALWIEEWYTLYKQYNPDFILTNEELKITQLAALWHDSARANDGVDFWDNESATFFFTYLVADMHLPIEKAKEYAEIIANKDKKPNKVWCLQLNEETGEVSWNQQEPLLLEKSNESLERMRVLLHDADCLDIMRCHNFNKKYLDFFKQYEDNDAALSDLQTLCLKARGIIFQMGDLSPHENPRIAEGFNQPSCGQLVLQLSGDWDFTTTDVSMKKYFARGIENPTMKKRDGTRAEEETLLSKKAGGNSFRSAVWMKPGEALFADSGFVMRNPAVQALKVTDGDTGYGTMKRSATENMSDEQIRAAQSEIKKDRNKNRPTSSSYQDSLRNRRKFWPYNEATVTVEGNKIVAIYYTQDPTWVQLDYCSNSLSNAMYLQWLIKKNLNTNVPIYEYSGVNLKFKKRFEGMVTEEQAITAFRDQIRRFFNKSDSRQIEALLRTDDDIEMKAIICYGSTCKIDTLTKETCPLSSPDQWLSKTGQDKLTELIVMKKWNYILNVRLPLIKRNIDKKSFKRLSFLDIKLMIENKNTMNFGDEAIKEAIKNFINSEMHRCYDERNVVGSPIFHLVGYLSTHCKSHPEYWSDLINNFKERIKNELSPSFFAPSQALHYVCQKSGLSQDKDISELLEQKKEQDFQRAYKKFSSIMQNENPHDVHDLCVSLMTISPIFNNENTKGTTLFEGANMSFSAAIEKMKEQLALRILNACDSTNSYNPMEQFVWLSCDKNGILDDTALSLINRRLESIEGKKMHYDLLRYNTAIFTSGTEFSWTLLKRTINSLHSPSYNSQPYKLVFDCLTNTNTPRISIFNILNDLVHSDNSFMEANSSLAPWFLQKAEALWESEINENGWSHIDSQQKAKDVIQMILTMSARDIEDNLFSKIAISFPSGPCEKFIASIDFLITNENQFALEAVFSSEMSASRIIMMERIFSVQSVKNNALLQRKIQRLLDLHSDKLPYALKDCMKNRVVTANSLSNSSSHTTFPPPPSSTSSSTANPKNQTVLTHS